ncbi:MAG: glycosyltransferase [Anaerolineales bacterium]|nr:glycosyltransferase [Anaerolineales bacterium]
MTKILNISQNDSSSDSRQKDQLFLSSSFPRSASEKMPFIFAASRLGKGTKNMNALEAVAPRLPWPVYMAGPKEANGAPARLRHINLVGRLDFEELQSWFAWASIYVMPTGDEPSHQPVLQAARAGCALVLSDTPSLRRMWGNAALYAPPDDLETLEVALVLLIADSIYLDLMAKRAFARAQKLASEWRAGNYFSNRIYDLDVWQA